MLPYVTAINVAFSESYSLGLFCEPVFEKAKTCHLSSRCSESTIFTFALHTQESPISGSFGTPNCMQGRSKSTGGSSEACFREGFILGDLWSSSRRGGDPRGGCKWSPLAVGRYPDQYIIYFEAASRGNPKECHFCWDAVFMQFAIRMTSKPKI